MGRVVISRILKSALQKFFREIPEKKFDPLENPIQWESFPDLRAEIADLKEVVRILTTVEVVEPQPYTILPGPVEPLEGSSGLRMAQRMSAYALRLERELTESRKLAERHWNSLTRLRKKNKMVGNPNKKGTS